MTPRERPESIRAYLAAGGDPTDLDAWRLLAEIVCDREADGEHQTLQYCRRWLAELDAGGIHALTPMIGPESLEAQERRVIDVRRRCQWEIELLEDHALAARFEAALPPEAVVEARSNTEITLRPWAVSVEAQTGSWLCAVTGEMVTGPAVVLVDRETGERPVLISPVALADVLHAAGLGRGTSR
jgi:hypothetical protein